MASQQNVSRGGTDKNHKSTIDGGLKMKIMRAKSSDRTSSTEPKQKIFKSKEPNGSETKADSIVSSSGEIRQNEAKSLPSVHRSKTPTMQTKPTMVFTESSNVPTPFSTKNVPVPNLLSIQPVKHQYPYLGHANLNRGADNSQNSSSGFFSDIGPPKESSLSEAMAKNGSGKVVQSSLLMPANRNPALQTKKRQKGEMIDQCVGTSFGTLTEPECLGPCEPGTSVNLDGIVWHETEDGILVVNATWRGKPYIGTLLDSTRHAWAPPRPNGGNEEWDCRTRAGRAKRRSATYGPDVNSPLNSKTRSSTNRVRGRRVGGIPEFENLDSLKRPASPRLDMQKFRDESFLDDSSQMHSLVNPITGLQVEIPNNSRQPVAPCAISPVLLECPESGCKKRYKNAHGLRYHQSRAHKADCFDEDSRQSLESLDVVSSKEPSPPRGVLERNQLSSSVGESIDGVNGINCVSSSTEDTNSQACNKENELPQKDASIDDKCVEIYDKEFVYDATKDQLEIKITARLPNEHCNMALPASTSGSDFEKIKKNLFGDVQPDQSGLSDNNKEVTPKTPTIECNSSSRACPGSPAYSDISDDSVPFANTDFIDKIIKSTESKMPLQELDGNLNLGNGLNAYQPQQQHQGYNISPVIPPIVNPPTSVMPPIINPPVSLNSEQSSNNDKVASTGAPLFGARGNLPCTTSSTFINPYNLVNSGFFLNVNPTTEDHRTLENSNVSSKKEESSDKDSGRQVPKSAQLEVISKEKDSVSNETSLNVHTKDSVLTSSQQQQPHHSLPPKSSDQAKQIAPPSIQQSNDQSSQNNRVSQEDKVKSHTVSSTESGRNFPSNQPGQQQQSFANVQNPYDQVHYRNQSQIATNQSVKEEKTGVNKQEPPPPSINRPLGPPQFVPQSNYLNPNYGYNSPYPQYPSYNAQYYPRYPLTTDQTKSNMGQVMPNSQYNQYNPNFSAPNQMAGYLNPTTSPAQTSTNANAVNSSQRMDPNRMQSAAATNRASTHFHTHHHTHVGLSYPVYTGSYEGQQNTTNPIIAQFSPRQTK
ncbi:unnamed protein product [Hermetia illucens]|uniref:C2H2-type domain-containing protein n=1 Tax=Hermetia illucens TaxID=343691 RepID=A0A7R8UD23_HERIL|nr:unnamed protein product [Hermetia illucens]